MPAACNFNSISASTRGQSSGVPVTFTLWTKACGSATEIERPLSVTFTPDGTNDCASATALTNITVSAGDIVSIRMTKTGGAFNEGVAISLLCDSS